MQLATPTPVASSFKFEGRCGGGNRMYFVRDSTILD